MKNIDTDLKKTTEYLENVLENSPDAIGIVDAKGKFIKWNRMAARLYGFSFHELKGKSAFDLYDSPEELSAMLDKLRKHGVIKNYEINMKRKDGAVIPFDVSMSLLTDGMNNVVGSVCVARDLSEIKKTLRALKAANEQLQRFAVELEQKNEEIKQFAYIVSHDLRASLVNLKGFAGELRYGVEVVEAAIHDKVISCLDEKQRMAVTAALKEDLPEALGFIESSVTCPQ